jgi:hypothetical protein
MKTSYHFFIAIFAAAFLSGCSSSSSPSKDDVDKAIRSYVGLARNDIGDVKLDQLKIVNESQQKIGDDDVFLRQFEAHYTVTYEKNPSKHSFEGTVALVKQGHEWVLRKEECKLAFANSPPVAATVQETATNRSQESIQSQAKP